MSVRPPAPSSRRHDALLDRLLAPASGLMARLRFGQKAMVIGASFVVTCALPPASSLVQTRRDGGVTSR